jgi:copper chaperone CopZ
VIAREVPKDAVWTTLSVEGMTCGGCEQRIIANVGSIEGIFAVEADAELGQVRVATAKGSDGLKREAADKISSLGYRVQ